MDNKKAEPIEPKKTAQQVFVGGARGIQLARGHHRPPFSSSVILSSHRAGTLKSATGMWQLTTWSSPHTDFFISATWPITSVSLRLTWIEPAHFKNPFLSPPRAGFLLTA